MCAAVHMIIKKQFTFHPNLLLICVYIIFTINSPLNHAFRMEINFDPHLTSTIMLSKSFFHFLLFVSFLLLGNLWKQVVMIRIRSTNEVQLRALHTPWNYDFLALIAYRTKFHFNSKSESFVPKTIREALFNKTH